MVVEPADHVRLHRELRVLGVGEFAGPVGFLVAAVEPGADEELLLAAGARSAAVLASDVAVDRADAHEVVPASDRETGDVHLVEESRAVFIGPIAVVGGVTEPFGHKLAVVFGDAGDLVHCLEPLGSGGAADAIAFVKQAEASVDHVLGREVRRLGDREEVLREAGLGAAEGSDLAGGPGLDGQPLDEVVAVFLLAPAEGAVAAPDAFGFLRAAEVGEDGDVTALARRAKYFWVPGSLPLA